MKTKKSNLYVYKKEYLNTHNIFFDRVISEFNLEKIDADIIAVLHLLQDAIPFTRALQKIGNLKIIIPKPRSVNQEIFDFLSKKSITIINKEYIGSKIRDLKQKTVFLDIGGYFSKYTDQLIEDKLNFAGIVEDTENGLQKYKKQELTFPFLSVAHSPLKDNEDLLVGEAISYSVERILREQNIIISGLNLGVLGFGKIGSSVAINFLKKGASVSVFDKNNICLIQAVSQGFSISNKDKILSKSKIICLATGNNSLTDDDFGKIKNGAFIFSVTSSDDEFDKNYLEENFKKKLVAPYIVKYSREEQYFYLLNDGETINFVHGSTVGDFILLVHAELLLSAYKLLKSEIKIGEQKLTSKERDRIAKVWIDVFKLGLSSQERFKLHKNAIELIKRYNSVFLGENTHILLEYVKNTPNSVSRKNKDGHFTASGLIIKNNEVLFIFHNKLQRYLQPGGHLDEADGSIVSAAKREVEEETGLIVKTHTLFGDMPIHIDIHKIPENKKKNESMHFHYDCMFVFELSDKKSEIDLQKEEVSGYKWVSLENEFKDIGIKKAIEKIKGVLQARFLS